MHTLHYKSGILKEKKLEKEATVRARNQEIISSMQKSTKVDSVSIKSDSIKSDSIKNDSINSDSIKNGSIKSVDSNAKNDDSVGSIPDAENDELNISQVKAPFGDTKIQKDEKIVSRQDIKTEEKEVPINGQAALINGQKPKVRAKGPFDDDAVPEPGNKFT